MLKMTTIKTLSGSHQDMPVWWFGQVIDVFDYIAFGVVNDEQTRRIIKIGQTIEHFQTQVVQVFSRSIYIEILEKISRLYNIKGEVL